MFSHSSSEYGINQIVLSAFPNPSGRLIHYSRETRKTTVLLDKLWFANGIALPSTEDFVVVASRLFLKCYFLSLSEKCIFKFSWGEEGERLKNIQKKKCLISVDDDL